MKHINETELLMNRAMRAAIRARQAVLNLNAVDVARRAGIPESTMSRYLNGKTSMNAGTLFRISDALDTSLEELARHAVILSKDDSLPED